jgi:hypothetical protein
MARLREGVDNFRVIAELTVAVVNRLPAPKLYAAFNDWPVPLPLWVAIAALS